MKPRLLLIFALLTLMGLSLAAAAMAEPAAPQAAPVVADASSSPASFLCSLNKSVSTPEAVAGLNPAPLLKAGTCGACSTSPCVGATNGVTYCSLGTRLGRCQDVYGDVCTDGTLKCQCWSGPLP